MTLNTIKLLTIDVIVDVLFWPIWWYSLGLAELLRTLLGSLRDQEQRLGVVLWWRHLFVPMYGQYDWQGRVISFVVRLFVGIGRTLVLAGWLAWLVLCLILWMAVLPTAAYLTWEHLTYYFAISWGG